MTIMMVEPQQIDFSRRLRTYRANQARACHGVGQPRLKTVGGWRKVALTAASLVFDLLLVVVAGVLVWNFVVGWQWTAVAGNLG